MKIINPIYDNAFKYLMDNEKIAKIILSIILDTKVINLQSKPQEVPLRVQNNINLSRFDFKAIIEKENGEHKTVLIELQKYKSENPIERFRHYLAQNYMKKETVKGEKEEPLPIISIYILGYDLPEFNCRAIRVDNKQYDIVGQKELSVKSQFVDLLTHQAFILIAAKKAGVEVRNTRLEKFLNLFIQKLQGEEKNTVIEIDVESELDASLKSIINYLGEAIMNETLLKSIKAEKDFYQSIGDLEKAVEDERRQKEEALAKIQNTVIKLHEKGFEVDQISEMTGETPEKVRSIIEQE